MGIVTSKIASAVLWAGLTLFCVGCDGAQQDRPIRISVIGATSQIKAPLTHADSQAGKVTLMAVAHGLVTYDEKGDVVPGLAQRWIVTDDGTSYIFRLRRAHWADGTRVEAKDVKRILRARLHAAIKRDPYGSLASVSEILAMTGDVLEIRLKAAQPSFLMALAEPQLAIAKNGGGTGPYHRGRNDGDTSELLLKPVDAIGDVGVAADKRDLRLLRAESAARAIVRFRKRDTDLVLGGTLAELPYVTLAKVRDDTVRFDPVLGLFGLTLSNRNPIFDDAQVREALSMAIEREAIVSYFDISRWKIMQQILPQQLDLPQLPTFPSWLNTSIEDRRNLAVGTITRWRAQHNGKPVVLTIALPKGPGMDLLFLALKAQYHLIGVEVKKVERHGDLTLVDEVAPYDSAAWYLSRLSCARGVHCDKDAEALLKSSISAATTADRLALLSQAEPLIERHNGFIPLATPVRWSLVGSRLNAYSPSPRGLHNLLWLKK